MPKFYCYNCGQHIDADESLAGKAASCPSCQIELLVPGEMSESSASLRKRGKLFPRPRTHDKPVQNQDSATDHTFSLIKAEHKIIPLFKEKLLSWGPTIINIPDEMTKVCLLSIFYYYGEFSYGGKNTWYVPERYLAGDISRNFEQYMGTTDIFYDALKEIINNLMYYATTKQAGFLQNLRELAPEVLYHCKFPIVHGLEQYV